MTDPRPTTRSRILAVFACMTGLLAGVMAAVGKGETPRECLASPDEKDALKPGWANAKGVCNICHRSSKDVEDVQVTEFVQLNEFRIWDTEDKHSDAFTNLKSPLSKHMGERLQWDVSARVECLSCHAPASDLLKVKIKDNRLKAEALTGTEKESLGEGVSCVACHGAYKDGWVVKHHGGPDKEKQEAWIRTSPQDKHDKYGMNDLRDPAVRSQVCTSCHVGDQAQGRVVTHSMYAAGHPPLPGVEIATFSKGEQPHWAPMKDVKYFKNVDFKLETNENLVKYYRLDQSATQYSRLVAIGGVVSFRKAMQLFAETSQAKGMPDFARFDCASCHHELRVSEDSFRQKRGYGALDPGRPPVAVWPTALLRVAIAGGDKEKVAGRLEELEARLKALHDDVADRPFGNKEKSVKAADALAAWAGELKTQLDGEKLDRAAILRMLGKIAATTPRDHASARQLVWGFEQIYGELTPKPANDSQIRSGLADLVITLNIKLYPGDKKSITRDLGARLDADEKFDPMKVQDSLEKLGKLLAD